MTIIDSDLLLILGWTLHNDLFYFVQFKGIIWTQNCRFVYEYSGVWFYPFGVWFELTCVIFLWFLREQWWGTRLTEIRKHYYFYNGHNNFGIARNWWDINKQQPTASSFWIPVFVDIQKVHFIYEINKRQLNTTNILKHIHIK